MVKVKSLNGEAGTPSLAWVGVLNLCSRAGEETSRSGDWDMRPSTTGANTGVGGIAVERTGVVGTSGGQSGM